MWGVPTHPEDKGRYTPNMATVSPKYRTEAGKTIRVVIADTHYVPMSPIIVAPCSPHEARAVHHKVQKKCGLQATMLVN